jgi:hypothetical protein
MDKEHFAFMLSSIAGHVVYEISKRHGIPELDASRLLYNSHIYRLLENEKTKVWHFSPMTLCQMLDDEIIDNDISLPEET